MFLRSLLNTSGTIPLVDKPLEILSCIRSAGVSSALNRAGGTPAVPAPKSCLCWFYIGFMKCVPYLQQCDKPWEGIKAGAETRKTEDAVNFLRMKFGIIFEVVEGHFIRKASI